MQNHQTKIRIFVLLAVLLVNVLCTVLVWLVPIPTTAMKVVGSYFAILLVGCLAWRFPLRFYLTAMGFVFLASTLGSCVNLYRHVGFYDLFVHYASGLVLAEGGYLLAGILLQKRELPQDAWVKALLAFFFSCAGAAFWEIYEFIADQLAHAQMQGSKENTMGDIIAGVLGAATHLTVVLLAAIKSRAKKTVNSKP